MENEWLIRSNINVDSLRSCIEDAEKKDIFAMGINDRSTTGQNSKQWDFTKFDLLANYITKKLLDEIYPFNIREYKSGNAWMVEGGEGSYHRLHRHVRPEQVRINPKERPHNKNLAVVCYLDVPPMPCGEFYFLLKKDNDIEINAIENLKPGDMFVFPSTVYHGVYPQGPGKRTTVNIDYDYAGKD